MKSLLLSVSGLEDEADELLVEVPAVGIVDPIGVVLMLSVSAWA
jgi:hypothetical protein